MIHLSDEEPGTDLSTSKDKPLVDDEKRPRKLPFRASAAAFLREILRNDKVNAFLLMFTSVLVYFRDKTASVRLITRSKVQEFFQSEGYQSFRLKVTSNTTLIRERAGRVRIAMVTTTQPILQRGNKLLTSVMVWLGERVCTTRVTEVLALLYHRATQLQLHLTIHCQNFKVKASEFAEDPFSFRIQLPAIASDKMQAFLALFMVAVTLSNIYFSKLLFVAPSNLDEHYGIYSHHLRNRKLQAQGIPIQLLDMSSSGIVTCLSDQMSVLHALALAESVDKKGSKGENEEILQLEIHYDPSTLILNNGLKEQLLSYGNVQLNALPPEEYSIPCQVRARQATNFGRAVWIQDPSVIFLQDPTMVIQAVASETPAMWIELESQATSVFPWIGYDNPSAWIFETRALPGAAWAYPKTLSLHWISHQLSTSSADIVVATNSSVEHSSLAVSLEKVQAHWRSHLLSHRHELALLNETVAPMLAQVPEFYSKARTFIKEEMTRYCKKAKEAHVSEWGVASSYDWASRDSFWLNKGKNVEASIAHNLVERTDVSFHTITKPLTALLLYRLQELELLRLDDLAPSSPNHFPNATWRHILTNTAAQEGEFSYSNTAWERVIDEAVGKATGGMRFVKAFQTYVADPMGLMGAFDTGTKNKDEIPYEARGYRGPMDDLLLLGCTLANGGVSPKTRQQVLSWESLEDMLALRVPAEDTELGPSLRRAPLARAMKDLKFPGKATRLFRLLTGYGTGMWHFEGVRNNPRRMKAWVGVGQAMLYFDETGLVVAAHIPRAPKIAYKTLEPFVQAIRSIGDYLTEQIMLPPTAVSVETASSR